GSAWHTLRRVFFRLGRETALILGYTPNTTSHREKLLSAIGVFLGIAAIWGVTHWVLPAHEALWVIASMGASSILIFGVPHAALAQPWPVVGGHVLSACVGITLLKLAPDAPWMPALAVALAVAIMHYGHCMHPPGGATALAVVVGGPSIESLGYAFILEPLLLNVGVVLATAVLFSSVFPWRRYPARFARLPEPIHKPGELLPEDFYNALRQMDSYIDIRFEDLQEVMQLAEEHARQRHTKKPRIPGLK
ncbi:MAG: HPP family protein, partial [Gammaproteobacteria bacterium]|nr:HPP family protein [Gammaproteobacteria bacterium]